MLSLSKHSAVAMEDFFGDAPGMHGVQTLAHRASTGSA